MTFARRMARLSESATAAVFGRVAQLRAEGVDVVSLAVGEPDAAPPAHVNAAVARALAAGPMRYTEVEGLRSLRTAICEDSFRRRGVRHDPAQVVVSAGAKHTLFNLAQVLYDHGDEVVIPVPAWVSYADQALLCGATPVLVPCSAEDGFLLRPEALAAAITPRTKAIVLCTPSNPTGAAYGEAELRAIAEVLRARGGSAFVIVDEIYGELTYDGFVQRSLLSVAPDLRERVIIVDGVSKRYAMTGYRVGWMLGPTAIARACVTLQGQATTNVATVAQHAAQAALEGPDDAVQAMRDALQERRDLLLGRLRAIPGLSVERPRGAFYLFADARGLIARAGLAGDAELARALLDRAGVAVVPGTAFGAEGYLRFSYATAREQLQKAADRIEGFAARL